MAAIDSYSHLVLPKRYLKVEGVPEVLKFLSTFLMKGFLNVLSLPINRNVLLTQQGEWNGAGVADV